MGEDLPADKKPPIRRRLLTAWAVLSVLVFGVVAIAYVPSLFVPDLIHPPKPDQPARREIVSARGRLLIRNWSAAEPAVKPVDGLSYNGRRRTNWLGLITTSEAVVTSGATQVRMDQLAMDYEMWLLFSAPGTVYGWWRYRQRRRTRPASSQPHLPRVLPLRFATVAGFLLIATSVSVWGAVRSVDEPDWYQSATTATMSPGWKLSSGAGKLRLIRIVLNPEKAPPGHSGRGSSGGDALMNILRLRNGHVYDTTVIYNYVEVAVSWVLLGVFCVVGWGIWAWRFVAYQSARTRSLAGYCMHCGYDLRATPNRCPECGREATVRVVAKSRSANVID